MSRRLCMPAALLAAFVALGGTAPTARSAPAPLPKKAKVEIVFVVDTTGSMGTYIDTFRSRYWAICNLVAAGKPSPDLKIGLVDYKDRGDPYVTKVYDLSDDLDGIYAHFATFRADGGGDEPESVNQALDDAVNKVKWSKDKKTLKVIFLVGDAAPHMDYPDDVKYPVTCKVAVKKGIIIHTVACGGSAEMIKHWKEIATATGGSFMNLPGSGTGPTSSHDRRLAEIYAELNKNVLIWGSGSKRTDDAKKATTVSSLSPAMAADRASYFAKKGMLARYDLLDSIRHGKVRLEGLKADDLPDALRKMDAKERRAFLDKLAKTRAGLRAEALDLDKRRTAEIIKELERNKTYMESQVLEVLRKHAKKHNLRY